MTVLLWTVADLRSGPPAADVRDGAAAPGSAGTPAAVAPALEDPTLRVSTAVTGLNQPTKMAFVGSSSFLVLEKNSGKVLHVVRGAIAGTAIDLAVNAAGDRGALGIATDPSFASNGFVYLFWTWRGGGSGTGQLEGSDTASPGQVPDLPNRVDRFVWTGSRLRFDRNLLRLPSRAVLNTEGRLLIQHNGGVLEFGPDEKLYVFTGDQTIRGKLQNVRSGASARNANLTGVVLRLNADGTTPRDNPFYDHGASVGGQVGRNLQRIFAYGLRNSFGLAFDPVGGHLWMQENGDDAFDEINRVLPGLNSRWIQMMGPRSRYDQYRRLEAASPDGLDNPDFPPSRLAPTGDEALRRLYRLPGSADRDPAFSWKFNMGLAGIGFVESTALGAAYYGDLFVGDANSGSLYRFELTGARSDVVLSDSRLADRVADNAFRGDLKESESLTAGSGFGVVTDIVTAPGGNLFLVSFTDGRVYQISRR